MKETHFEIMLPKDVVEAFGWAENEVPARVREVLAMELLRRDAISQRKAAELLQLNLRDLFEMMGHYKGPTIDLRPEELHRELHKASEPCREG